MTFSTIKDPEAVIDYTIDWTPTMNESSPADTISTSTWAADSGVVVDSDSKTTTHTTVWVSGGTRGQYCNLVNTITTAAGRTHPRTISLLLQDK